MKPVRRVARAMLGAMFIRSGFDAVRHPERLADAAKPVTDRVAPVLEAINPSLPTDAKTLVRVTGAAHVLGGLMLATDRAPRAGAALLAGTLVPTARRAARATARGTHKATRGTRRAARTTARETRLALLAAKACRLFPG